MEMSLVEQQQTKHVYVIHGERMPVHYYPYPCEWLEVIGIFDSLFHHADLGNTYDRNVIVDVRTRTSIDFIYRLYINIT